ncbi:MAG: hypothetical protein ACRECY_16475 [Phyllobacterium sp.]
MAHHRIMDPLGYVLISLLPCLPWSMVLFVICDANADSGQKRRNGDEEHRQNDQHGIDVTIIPYGSMVPRHYRYPMDVRDCG